MSTVVNCSDFMDMLRCLINYRIIIIIIIIINNFVWIWNLENIKSNEQQVDDHWGLFFAKDAQDVTDWEEK